MDLIAQLEAEQIEALGKSIPDFKAVTPFASVTK